MMPAVENILTADGKLMFILQLWHFWGAVGNVLVSLSKQDDKEASNNCATEREIKQEQHVNQMQRRKENVLCRFRCVICDTASRFSR